jgi:hypothetical protein
MAAAEDVIDGLRGPGHVMVLESSGVYGGRFLSREERRKGVQDCAGQQGDTISISIVMFFWMER